MPELQEYTEFDRAVRLHIYYYFAALGRAPAASETAEGLSVPLDDAEESYRRLAEGRVIVLNPGTPDIRMANPLSAIPTPFRVEAIGRAWYGNCVWDALGVVAMFGGSGKVIMQCGDCGEPMTLTVKDGALVKSDGVIHFAIPAAHWWDDIIYT